MLGQLIKELLRANMDAHQVISTILRHDRKQNSYKIALLRAIGDVALCIHEWSLFTETVDQWGEGPVGRGEAYQLLTARPDNRRPLTWERNQVDLLIMEGRTFTCPWTRKPIAEGSEYDLDHLLPLSVYPVNELWNLVPANPTFNKHKKRDRLPSEERLAQARPHLQSTYDSYMESTELARAMEEDVAVRFADLDEAELPTFAADAAVQFIDRVASARNLERF